MNDFKVGKYERRGFQGSDVSLDISLNEYGLIWKRYQRNNKKKDIKAGDYLFIATWQDSSNTRILTHFWLNEKVNLEEEYNWVEWLEVADYCGQTKKEFLESHFPTIISDLVRYYGIQNFTTPY